jgi:hypothetical protein
MAESGKYLIGESLRERLKSTIAKVDSIPFGGPVGRIPTIHEEGPSSSTNPRRLIAPLEIQIPSFATNGLPPLLAVRLTGSRNTMSDTDSGTTPYAGSLFTDTMTGDFTDLAAYSDGLQGPLGVTLTGSSEPVGSVIQISAVIAGLTAVRVRRFDPSHKFAISPLRRISEGSTSNHRGILDSHPCACESSVRVVSYAGDATTYKDSTNAPIVWAVVIV